MEEFPKQILDLINAEIDKRTEKKVKERLNGIVKNLIPYLSINDISRVTGLNISEVRDILQEIVDVQNRILKLCGKGDKEETIETLLISDKLKSSIGTEEIIDDV